jgi:hypothetical protein
MLRWAVRIALIVVAVPLVAVVLIAGSVLFFRVTGQAALNRALAAVADGTPVPADIRLDLGHLSIQLQEPGEFAALLRRGYRVTGGMWLGDELWDFASPQWAFDVDVQRDIGLVCETHPGDAWSIYCGQVSCDDKPCTWRVQPPPSEESLRQACASIPPLRKVAFRLMGYPTTLEEGVDEVLAALPDDAREELRTSTPDDLARYHLSLGLWIRNALGLWNGNYELTCAACGGLGCHPDEASSAILRAVRDRLIREQAERSPREHQ